MYNYTKLVSVVTNKFYKGENIMKKFLKKSVAFMACGIILASVLTGCKASSKTVVMGTNAAFPPFEYYDGDKITGFDVEIAQQVAKELGVELKIEDIAFQGLITSLESQKVDFVAAGMSINEDRKKSVDFSDSYYEASQVIIVPKDNEAIKGEEDLKGKNIGVQIGTTGADVAHGIENAKVVEFNTGFAAIMDMQNGKIDAVVLDSEPAKNFAKANDKIKVLDKSLTTEQYAIAVKKGNEKVLKAVNKALKELKDSGEYDKLFEKYFK